jgi:hypothetical protein
MTAGVRVRACGVAHRWISCRGGASAGEVGTHPVPVDVEHGEGLAHVHAMLEQRDLELLDGRRRRGEAALRPTPTYPRPGGGALPRPWGHRKHHACLGASTSPHCGLILPTPWGRAHMRAMARTTCVTNDGGGPPTARLLLAR